MFMNLIKKLSKNVKLDCSSPEKIRELYVHEDELINHRMTWLGVTQTLLFAAYGVAIQEKSEPHCATNNIDQLLK